MDGNGRTWDLLNPSRAFEAESLSRRVKVTPANLSGVGSLQTQIAMYINSLGAPEDGSGKYWVEYDDGSEPEFMPIGVDLSNLIPYTGATKDVDLGNHTLTATNLISKASEETMNTEPQTVITSGFFKNNTELLTKLIVAEDGSIQAANLTSEVIDSADEYCLVTKKFLLENTVPFDLELTLEEGDMLTLKAGERVISQINLTKYLDDIRVDSSSLSGNILSIKRSDNESIDTDLAELTDGGSF